MASADRSRTPIRVNLGCGKYKLPGYINVDADIRHRPELIADVTQMSLRNVDEIVIRHLLEHLPFRGGEKLVKDMRDWLVPGGKLVVEVPDMEAISRTPDDHMWPYYTYGSQSSFLECHLSGYTPHRLERLIRDFGFGDVSVSTFDSKFSPRVGMPCLEITAYKK